MKSVKQKRRCRMIVIVVLVYIMFEIWSSARWLSVEYFSMSSDKVKESFRIVVLSDLHNTQFGKDNQKLISKIEEQNPDLILMLGDMLNENSKNPDKVTHLVKKLVKEVPVYYSFGNHEEEYIKKNRNELLTQLNQAGAVVLDKKYEDIIVKENEIRIGAMYEYAFKTAQSDREYKDSEGYQVMTEFENTDSLTLFMTHRPEAFLWSYGKDKDNWRIDGVFSGHVHGGQMRLPFIGGLYGIEQGWFPEYYDGKYELGDSQFFITRGLGTNLQPVPRVWNRPQIMVVDVKDD